MVLRSFFLRANKKVEENKDVYKERAEETKRHSARLVDMQRYVDMSEEKRALLLNLLKNGVCPDNPNETLLHRGVLVYVSFLDVIEVIAKDLEEAGIRHSVITGETSVTKRGEVSKKFKENPENSVVIISPACSESLNLNGSNILIMYSVGGSGISSPGKFLQLLGRVARGFNPRFDTSRGAKFYILKCIVDETSDEYAGVLLSSRKEPKKLEETFF